MFLPLLDFFYFHLVLLYFIIGDSQLSTAACFCAHDSKENVSGLIKEKEDYPCRTGEIFLKLPRIH